MLLTHCSLRTASEGIFRDDLSLDEFARSFAPHDPQIVRNKRERFVDFLNLARPPAGGEPGPLLARPVGFTPGWHARVETLPPLFNRLQASYDDVEHEADYIIAEAKRRDPECAMVVAGGDGAWFQRYVHLVARKQHKYLRSKPVVIPKLGEQPHGLFHITHAGWRVCLLDACRERARACSLMWLACALCMCGCCVAIAVHVPCSMCGTRMLESCALRGRFSMISLWPVLVCLAMSKCRKIQRWSSTIMCSTLCRS